MQRCNIPKVDEMSAHLLLLPFLKYSLAHILRTILPHHNVQELCNSVSLRHNRAFIRRVMFSFSDLFSADSLAYMQQNESVFSSRDLYIPLTIILHHSNYVKTSLDLFLETL